jgi:hypothetical protein
MVGRAFARTVVVIPVVAAFVAVGAIAGPPASATTSAAATKACKALRAKAINAAAKDPVGRGTPEERAYYERCPSADTLQVISLGTLSTYLLFPDAKGEQAGIVAMTSSNPNVIAIGAANRTTVEGKATRATIVQAVGMGTSRVCVTVTGGSKRCLLVVTPKAIAGKAGGRTLNVAAGNQPGAAAMVVSITSSDPSVVTVTPDPASTLPYVLLGQPGTTTICAKYTKGAGGCQQWTIGS